MCLNLNDLPLSRAKNVKRVIIPDQISLSFGNAMRRLVIKGIPQADLDHSLDRIQELQQWASKERIDRWAMRAALLKALNEDANDYFEHGKGDFREIAAFDNGVAVAVESLKEEM